MTTPTPITPGELERLAADLDAGVYDDQLPEPLGGLPAPAQPQHFSDLKQFDVKAWAERRGIKVPSR